MALIDAQSLTGDTLTSAVQTAPGGQGLFVWELTRSWPHRVLIGGVPSVYAASKSVLRRLARPLRIRIRSGPCAGMWFSLATRTRFLRGSYERKLAEFFQGGIQPGEVFWDAGAHFGYYTLLAAKAGARVHAFEPHAANRAFLEAHVRWNRLGDRVTVHACALGASDGRVEFGAGRGSGSRTLGTGPRAVEVRSISSLVAAGECESPDWLKVDVQGSEEQVLAGGERVLREASCGVACATHGPDLHERCTTRLEALGYVVLSGTARRVILAFGPGRAVPDVDVGAFDM